jgi:hypothetical protein
VGDADAPWQMRPQVIEVQIDYFSFMPHDITVAAGTTVDVGESRRRSTQGHKHGQNFQIEGAPHGGQILVQV